MNQAESEITIVLGAGVTERNRPGYDGKFRSLALIELLKQNPNRRVIFTGGKTAGQEFFSEAESMELYVLIMLSRMATIELESITEDEALDTVANLENSLKLIDKQGDSRIQILTNYYHVQRVRDVCTRLHIQAEIIQAEKIVAERTHRHRRLIEKRRMSTEMWKRQTVEKVLIFLNQFPFGQQFIKRRVNATRRK